MGKDLSDLWIDLGEIVGKYVKEGWSLEEIKNGMEIMWDGVDLEE